MMSGMFHLMVGTIFLAVIGMEAVAAPTPEPAELVSLRDAWRVAKENDIRPIKEKYLNALIALRVKLTKQEKLGGASNVQSEISLLTGGADGEKAAEPDATEPSKLSRLRGIYKAAVSKVDEAGDKRYRDALALLQRKFSQKGELGFAMSVKREIERQSPSGREDGLATLEVKSLAGGASVVDLKPGVRRVSGDSLKIDFVGEGLENAQFLRVPWKKVSQFQVLVTGNGTVYVMRGTPENLESTELEWREVEGMLRGPYLPKIYAVDLVKGDEFKIQGGAISLVAGEIELKK